MQFYVATAGLSSKCLFLLDLPTNRVVPFLSALKTALHHKADSLDIRWRSYIDLSVLAGYPRMEYRDMSDDPALWLSTPSHDTMSVEWWAAQFSRTFGENIRKSLPDLGLDDFVLSRWKWVTPGASTFSTALLDGNRVKTKFGAALSLSDDDLLSHANLEQPASREIGVFIKADEMGFKRRLIANVSLGPYLIAAYVRQLIQNFTGDNPSFCKLDTNSTDIIDVIQLIREGKTMMPLDESAYDYHVSRPAWLGFISFLKTTFPDNKGVLLFESFFHDSYWHFDGNSGQWVSGMPSGLALTSFLNSWINYIKQQDIVPGFLQWAAGDDVLVSPYSPISLTEVSARYKKFGSEVNSTKNWISHSYAEYLKVLYHSSGSTGYPARIYSSLIWAGRERTYAPPDRLNELADLFKQFYDRLGIPLDTHVVSTDLSKAVSTKVSGFTSVLAKQWLHAPAAYGGFGRIPYVPYTFDWKSTIIRKKQYTNVIIRVPETIEHQGSFSFLFKRRPIRSGVSFAVGPPLRLPPIMTLADWEARLNGDDNPLKGKYRNMALDVIPLPVIDGISSKNMSRFAQEFNFYTYPNLRGRSDRITDKLVHASLALLTKVREWCSIHRVSELSN